jgi:hypothetical protein
MRKADWVKLRQTFNPKLRSGICNIEITLKDADGNLTNNPDKAVTWKRIHDPQLVEECLLARNINHFGQAEGTFFTRQDITQSFEYEGTSPDALRLIEGTFNASDFPNVNSSARTLLELLGNKKNLETFDNDISFKELITAIKNGMKVRQPHLAVAI